MSVPCTETLSRREVAQSTDGRTGGCADSTRQQLQLPFTTWRPEVGDNTSTQELREHLPPASTKELQSTALAATLLDATAIRRRGPSLSRRIGQKGSVFQH